MGIKRIAFAFGIMFLLTFATESFGNIIKINNNIVVVDNDNDQDKDKKTKKSSKNCDQVKKDCKTPCKTETKAKCCDHGKATKEAPCKDKKSKGDKR